MPTEINSTTDALKSKFKVSQLSLDDDVSSISEKKNPKNYTQKIFIYIREKNIKQEVLYIYL